MRLFRRKKRPWFELKISLKESDRDLMPLMFPADNWTQGSFWWERLEKAPPRERVALLIGALAASETERHEDHGRH